MLMTDRRCPCSGTYDDRNVDIRMPGSHDDVKPVLTHVPQGACPLCGSRVYEASVLQRVELAVRAAQAAYTCT